MSTAEEQLATKDAEIKKIKQYVAKKLKESKDELDKTRGELDTLRDYLATHGVQVAPDLQSPPELASAPARSVEVEAQVAESTLIDPRDSGAKIARCRCERRSRRLRRGLPNSSNLRSLQNSRPLPSRST